MRHKPRTMPLFLAALLAVCMVFGMFAFTASAEDAPAVKAGDRKTLFDFETEYERAGIDSGYVFGTIKRTGEHVTSGKNSLYLEISGHSDEDNELHYAGSDHEFWGTNYIGLKTSDELYEAARDISAYDTFTVDFYNDSDRDTSVTVFLQTNMNGNYSALNGSFQRLGRKVLPKGKVSLLEFDLTYLQYNELDTVMRYWFFFDNINTDQTPLKLYMDNVAVERKQDDFKIDLPTAGVDNKITSFESKLETQMMSCRGWGVSYDQLPVLEWNNDPQYVSDGEGSLKITLSKSNNYCRCSSSAWSGSCQLVMPGALYFNGFNVNEMLESAGKTATDYEVVADVYNAGDKALDITILKKKNYSAAAKKWTEVRAPLSDFAFATGGTIDFTLEWVEFRDTADRVFYVDNFRIEEVAK